MQKCSDGDEHFSEHFFQLWNEIANTQKIAGWYKVYIRGISKPNKKPKMRAVRNGLRLVLTAYENFFLCFFVFVVCRFCTSKQSFGYVFLNLARCVFVKVFVRD